MIRKNSSVCAVVLVFVRVLVFVLLLPQLPPFYPSLFLLFPFRCQVDVLVGIDCLWYSEMFWYMLDGDVVTLVVAHVATLADGTVVAVTGEGLACGVVLLCGYLFLEGTGWTKLEAHGGRQGVKLWGLKLVGVETLTLGHLDDGEGAEGFDGYTERAFGELEPDLVEHMGQDCHDGGQVDAAPLDDVGGKGLKVGLGKHLF